MRQARLKARTDQPVGYYHCLSRVVERRFLWEDQDRERVQTVVAARGKLSLGDGMLAAGLLGPLANQAIRQ